MLLAIDIGNTNITCGLFEKDRLIKRFAFSTSQKQYYSALKRLLGRFCPEAVIIASVVPSATRRLGQDLKKLKIKKLMVLGKDIIVPIKNLYEYPKQVGQDRLVNAYAALTLYGAAAIVVDFGTAITFDIISKNKEYLGGIIVPGLKISLDALAAKTALLPKVTMTAPKGLIGRNTKNSILSGIVYGSSTLSDGLIQKLKSQLGRVRVIATGGNADFMSKYCAKFDVVDPDLTLKGLNLIHHHILRS